MSSAEFSEYIAYQQIEPFGEDRQDLRHAILPFLIASLFPKKGRRPKFSDFLLSEMIERSHKGKPRMSVQQMKATLKAVAAAFGRKKS